MTIVSYIVLYLYITFLKFPGFFINKIRFQLLAVLSVICVP